MNRKSIARNGIIFGSGFFAGVGFLKMLQSLHKKFINACVDEMEKEESSRRSSGTISYANYYTNREKERRA